MSAAFDTQAVLNRFLPAYLTSHKLHPRQRQVCLHLMRCRTPAMGAHVERCDTCGYEQVRYLSCRDRHCPRCQGLASAQWQERESERALPVPYYHVVFTVPDVLNPWIQLYPGAMYGQLFASAWATLKAFGENPRHLGGQLGMTAVLHTWGQTLVQHVHLHCLVPGGALTADGRWRSARGDYLFPVRALSRRFRGHFVSGLRTRFDAGELDRTSAAEVSTVLEQLMARPWVVYAKSCLGRTEQVVGYLARYSHRIALSDSRLVGVSGERVGLRYTDYRDGIRGKCLWLDGVEFVRRLLLHVLPKGFMRIRHYGFLANCCRADRTQQIQRALELPAEGVEPQRETGQVEFGVAVMTEPRHCPRCDNSGRLRLRLVLAAPPADTG